MNKKSQFLKSAKLAIAGVALVSSLSSCATEGKHSCMSGGGKSKCSSTTKTDKAGCASKDGKSSCASIKKTQ